MDIKTPSIILLSASPGSGKTYMIKHLLYTLSRAGRFKSGLVFTNTSFNNAYDFLPNKAVGQYSEDKLKRFLRFQRDCAAEGNPRPAFLVLDDILGSIDFNSQLWTMIFTQFRHFHLTLIISTQYIYKIPPTSRACATYSFLFRPQEGRSLKAIWETYFTHLKFEDYKRMIYENTGDYYAIFAQNQAADLSKKYSKFKAPSTPAFKLTY